MAAAHAKKTPSKAIRNQFNMQWTSEREKQSFIAEAEKMGIKKIAEYIRAIHREHKDKQTKI